MLTFRRPVGSSFKLRLKSRKSSLECETKSAGILVHTHRIGSNPNSDSPNWHSEQTMNDLNFPPKTLSTKGVIFSPPFAGSSFSSSEESELELEELLELELPLSSSPSNPSSFSAGSSVLTNSPSPSKLSSPFSAKPSPLLPLISFSVSG